jgi:hypothetical protein
MRTGLPGLPRIKACFGHKMWFIFNLHRELFFYLVHTYKKQVGAHLLKENILLGKVIPFSWWRIRHPLSSLAQNQLPLRPLHFPRPLHPLLFNRTFILHKDDINKPDTSVGHRYLNRKGYCLERMRQNNCYNSSCWTARVSALATGQHSPEMDFWWDSVYLYDMLPFLVSSFIFYAWNPSL